MALLRAEGARIHALHVGDLRVTFAAPWPPPPAPEARKPGVEPTKDEEQRELQAKLTKLRDASRRSFGRVLADDELLKLEGVL